MSESATRIALLSKVGALAGMLEYDEVLAAVARLSIPEFADWCIATPRRVRNDVRVARAALDGLALRRRRCARKVRRVTRASQGRRSVGLGGAGREDFILFVP
jgi:hypothetical protein